MKKSVLLLSGAVMLLQAIPATAQPSAVNPEESVVEVIVGDKGATVNVEEEFIDNAPKKRNDNGLPRFAIVGNDNKFYLGVGAQFLGEAVYDFGDPMPSVYAFVPSSIGRRTPGNGSQLRFTALTSNIYLNAVALPGTKDRVGLFFKAQVNDGGNNYGFFVQHFYVTYRGFQAGYTSSLFADGAAMPYTIDDQGPDGSANLTLFTANYTVSFAKNFSFAVGVEQPTANLTTGNGSRTVNQRIPAIPLYLQYAWGKGQNSHVRLSGLVRPMQYRDLAASENKTSVGFGVQLSGLAAVTPAFTLYYDATYGHGIADYLQDETGLGLDAVPSFEKAGSLALMESMGVTGGFTVNITPRLALNAMYSHVTNWLPGAARLSTDVAPGEEGPTVSPDTYRYGDYVAANLMYTFNKILAAGIEYDYGHMKMFSGDSRHTNRLQAQLSVTF